MPKHTLDKLPRFMLGHLQELFQLEYSSFDVGVDNIYGSTAQMVDGHQTVNLAHLRNTIGSNPFTPTIYSCGGIGIHTDLKSRGLK